jgi:hypothetical protein
MAVYDIIKLVKVINIHSRTISKNVPSKGGINTIRTVCLADYCDYMDNIENEGVRDYRDAKNELNLYFSGLSLETTKDVMALMYLGRNAPLDDLNGIKLSDRISAYRNVRFHNGKDGMAEHIAGKSKALDKYLEDGLRIMRWE